MLAVNPALPGIRKDRPVSAEVGIAAVSSYVVSGGLSARRSAARVRNVSRERGSP
jgi:hypothetical protein